ncbi:MAG: formate dehydrogenase accessory protein FdhE [Actinomycetota bacterium]|nr:formate dehydrogenase accessory protein FdhE [Nitrospiraceae bacterium]MDA8157191.1 formate dehydrogenase accessory protein FdhE [Actinomycetota bacterium]
MRILAQGQVEVPAGKIHFLFLPGRDIFKRRAERFRSLSSSHPLGDYFSFLALLSDAQQKALDRASAPSLPDASKQALCRETGMPLLDCRTLQRDPTWVQGLEMILMQIKGKPSLTHTANDTVTGLMQADETLLEKKADRILAGDLADISPGELPFIAAALQVYWVHMATLLGGNAFGRTQQGGLCPVCGSPPGAGIIDASGEQQGLRYLCCSLCSSQWHMVRLKCSSCESTGEVMFYAIEGSNGAVKAEGCGACNIYQKLFYLEKDPLMETMADDLATIALDMMMDKEGYMRGGPNLFFHPGRLH